MSMNLSRPKWLTEEALENLENLVSKNYDYIKISESLKKIVAGPMIEKFLHNIKNSNKKRNGGKKIYLYSGHDYNIAAITRVHNFIDIPRIPDFGSGIIIEKLRGKDNQVYLRVNFYVRS